MATISTVHFCANETCGDDLYPVVPEQRYCSHACRIAQQARRRNRVKRKMK